MFKLIMSVFPTAIGLIVLLGWTLNNSVMRKAGTHFVDMNPATAIGIVLCGMALLVLHSGKHVRLLRYLAFALALVVLVGASLKMSDVILGADWRIDSRLFSQQLVHSADNRMAPNTAIALLFISCAICLSVIGARIATIQSQIIAVVCSFIAFLALIGYSYGNSTFYGIGRFTPIALHTAICLICLSASVLMVHARAGVMKYINNSGPAGNMARLFLPGAVVIPVALGAANLLALHSHLYAMEFGNSLSVVAEVAVLFIVTWVGARLLYIEDLRRQEVEKELTYRASHDRLTGLANRGVFFDMVQQRINILKRRGGAGFAVFYLDLDGFKQINDQLGHEAGDQLLVQTAQLFTKCTRATDVVARMGGDEFTILYEEIKDGGDVILLAQRILSTMPATFGPEPGIPIGVSIGIAFGKPTYTVSEDILREADQALYKAKSAGKGRYEVMHIA